MQVNKLVFVLLVLSVICALLPAPSLAEVMQTRNASGVVTDISSSNPVPTTSSSGGSGQGTVATYPNFVSVTNVLPLQYWGVGAPVSYQTALGTSTKILLTSLASFTANTYIEIQANAKIHYGSPSIASASLQNCMYLAAGEVKGFRVGTSTFDLAIIADAAAIASMDLKIYTLY